MAGPHASRVEIVEVGPRDGFQGIGPFIPTETKIGFLRRLAAAGLTRIEVGSFVSATAVPQLRDAAEILAASAAIPGIVAQVLVPNERFGRQAIAAGSSFLAFVLSVSETHNRSNVRRHPLESVGEYRLLLDALPFGTAMRLNIATAFDCPFTGRIAEADTMALLEQVVPLRPDAEICLCDTTGQAVPDQVERLFAAAMSRFPEVGRWALHAHDTFGLGLANVHAAWRVGVRVFDASFAGLGGCPFAPGATGNVATEDVVWMFHRMGCETGIDLGALVPVACDGADLPGALPGGRVRLAMTAAGAKGKPAGAPP